MLKELFESIWGKCSDAQKASVLEIPGTQSVLVQSVNGVAIHEKKKEIKGGRTVVVETLDDMIATMLQMRHLAEEIKSQYRVENESGSAIYISARSVVGLVDDLVGTAKVSVGLLLSEAYQELTELDTGFSVPQLIRWLKVKMDGTGADKYIDKFREIKFARAAASNQKVGSTSESFGREVENQVISANEIPEQLVLNVRIFKNVDIAIVGKIRVFVSIDYDASSITLTASKQDVHQAMADGMLHVRHRLKELTEGLDAFHVTTGNVLE